jgi:PleD family two-component response regulator
VTYVKKDDNEETLLERVDEALYEAKNSGILPRLWQKKY